MFFTCRVLSRVPLLPTHRNDDEDRPPPPCIACPTMMRPIRPFSPSFFPTCPAPATLGCTLGSDTNTILFYQNRTLTFPPPLRGRPRPPCPHLSGLTAHSPSIALIRPSFHAHLRTARPFPTQTPVPPTTRSSSPRQTTPLRTTSSNNASASVHSDSSCTQLHRAGNGSLENSALCASHLAQVQ